MNWLEIFSESRPDPGATTEEIARFTTSLREPLSLLELQRAQQNTHVTPTAWLIPQSPLPDSYLDFLRWSNGGWFRTVDREFGFFSTHDANGGVRAILLAYELPEYMRGSIPFAFDGGGTFYLFDMREEPANGEYPIVGAHAGYLDWEPEACWKIADSFLEACRDPRRMRDLRRR